jgi:hypothetical protein
MKNHNAAQPNIKRTSIGASPHPKRERALARHCLRAFVPLCEAFPQRRVPRRAALSRAVRSDGWFSQGSHTKAQRHKGTKTEGRAAEFSWNRKFFFCAFLRPSLIQFLHPVWCPIVIRHSDFVIPLPTRPPKNSQKTCNQSLHPPHLRITHATPFALS